MTVYLEVRRDILEARPEQKPDSTIIVMTKNPRLVSFISLGVKRTKMMRNLFSFDDTHTLSYVCSGRETLIDIGRNRVIHYKHDDVFIGEVNDEQE